MNYDVYEMEATPDKQTYSFRSVGPKGSIEKRVRFTRYPKPNWYNLALADIGDDGKPIYLPTDNGDMTTVMATVAVIITDYLDAFPDRIVLCVGSEDQRKMLYQRAVQNNMTDFLPDYVFHGYLPGSWTPIRMKPGAKYPHLDMITIEAAPTSPTI